MNLVKREHLTSFHLSFKTVHQPLQGAKYFPNAGHTASIVATHISEGEEVAWSSRLPSSNFIWHYHCTKKINESLPKDSTLLFLRTRNQPESRASPFGAKKRSRDTHQLAGDDLSIEVRSSWRYNTQVG
jgi:hypothetical protein